MKISHFIQLSCIVCMALLITACGKDNCDPTTWYADSDGDGLGEVNRTMTACEMPDGYVSNSDDKIYIGATFSGGLVFEIDASGEHGKVISPSDLGFRNWNDAKDRCKELTLEGHEDWYLPSIEELAVVYDTLFLHGIGNFIDHEYWSSSVGFAGGFAISKNFNTQDPLESSEDIMSLNQTRAVRSF